MRIYICCSKYFYDRVAPIKNELEKQGHIITLPNSYDDPFKEEKVKQQGADEHKLWKAAMMKLQEKKVRDNDAIVVLNFEKKGQKDYIGGATFLEMFKAWEFGKKLFLYNPIPDNIFKDELLAMDPIIINGDLTGVK